MNTSNKPIDEKWKWTEATDEEFESRRKDANYYRIYSISDGKADVAYKFWAKDDGEAYKTLEEFKKDHSGTGIDYFYSTSGYYIGPDGKRFDTLRESMDDFSPKDECPLRKIADFFMHTLPAKAKDAWFRLRDAAYFLKHGHSMTESWSLDRHMIEDLLFNLKKLSENTISYPQFMFDKANEKLSADPEHEHSDEEKSKLAMSMWRDELLRLREDVLLYMYYSDYGIVDDGDEDMAEIDAKYRDTLPYKPGTNKEFDYVKLHELAVERWNSTWDWIKAKGESLWG